MKTSASFFVLLAVVASAFAGGCGEGVAERRSADQGVVFAKSAAMASRTVSPESMSPPPQDNVLGTEPGRRFNTETYDTIVENPFLSAGRTPLSTFSIDVDTASYSIVRRFLNGGQLPPQGAVRIEELINYFPYEYPQPTGNVPFSVNVELADCPWNADHRLARIGLKGREVHVKERPATNLVFLIDVSGSMSDDNKLPLVKAALKMLVERLGESDRLAIVTYAGTSGVALPSTSAFDRSTIVAAIDELSAGGSTNGGAGIERAYSVAGGSFIKGGVNRVILCTDGDFNVGITDQSSLVRLIEQEARSGVFLTVLGFGMGNLKDSTMEKLADKGNGNYAYIDTLGEARKVLVDQLSGTLVTIAKDVKIQVDFNPARASGYRLVGYENRMLRPEDFKDDAKDAGEIGAGDTVTALYEIVPSGQALPASDVEPSKYQQPTGLTDAAAGRELFTVRLRYKDPEGQTSKSFAVPVIEERKPFHAASRDFQFAASVAQFGMLLCDSKYLGSTDFDGVLEVASSSIGPDRGGHRAEFVELARRARDLKRPTRHTGGLRSENDSLPEDGRDQSTAYAPTVRPRINQPVESGLAIAAESPDFSLDWLLRIVLLCLLAAVLLCPEKRSRRQFFDAD